MANSLSATNRKTILKSIQARKFDLIVIGGGITGARILLNAVTRGLNAIFIGKKRILLLGPVVDLPN